MTSAEANHPVVGRQWPGSTLVTDAIRLGEDDLGLVRPGDAVAFDLADVLDLVLFDQVVRAVLGEADAVVSMRGFPRLNELGGARAGFLLDGGSSRSASNSIPESLR